MRLINEVMNFLSRVVRLSPFRRIRELEKAVFEFPSEGETGLYITNRYVSDAVQHIYEMRELLYRLGYKCYPVVNGDGVMRVKYPRFSWRKEDDPAITEDALGPAVREENIPLKVRK